MFKRIAIIGLGLLGGSVCKTLRRLSFEGEITAFARNTARIQAALTDASIDHIEKIENIQVKDFDLIIIATPVRTSAGILKNILDDPGLGDHTLVIDVGSVKGEIVAQAEKHARADRFIGCHPMAGSEKMGYEYSKNTLYHNASVIITPHRLNNNDDITKIGKFWEMLGAKTIVISPDLHDSIVAYTSHSPHLLACALVDVLKDFSSNIYGIDLNGFIGNGFRDITRISTGSVDMWLDIIKTNRGNISAALGNLAANINTLKDIIDKNEDNDSLRRFLERVKHYREGIS